MKRFAFTLQRMLGFKQTMYEKERNALAQMRAERLVVEQRRDATLRQMLQADAEFRQKATVGVTRDEIDKMSYLKASGERLVEDLQDIMARMDVEIEKQLQIVIALDKEVQSLEKLRERQWEEYEIEARHEESDRILEIVSRRFSDEAAQAAEAEERMAQLRLTQKRAANPI